MIDHWYCDSQAFMQLELVILFPLTKYVCSVDYLFVGKEVHQGKFIDVETKLLVGWPAAN